MAKNNETLEALLNKSARLLYWHDKNKSPYFANYFHNHFYHIRALGYIVVCQQLQYDEIEVFYRLQSDITYRTKGVIIRPS